MQKSSLLTIIGLSASLFLLGCADDQARAQLADTNYKLSKLQDDVGRLKDKLDNQKSIDILNQIDNLQNQINQINGQLSIIGNNVKESAVLQSQINSDFDGRLQSLEGSNNKSQKVDDSVGDSKKQTYSNELQNALVTLKAKNFSKSITQLKNIIATNPDQDIVRDATYYLGIAYAANGQYKQSIAIATKFYQENPNNKNAPDAMRTVFISQMQMGNIDGANAVADKLYRMYPKSVASKKVQAELNNK